MFRRLDLFHQIIKLNYNESNRFATNVGGFFTIWVVTITLVQAFFTFKSILSFQSPQVTIDTTILDYPGELSLNSSEFIFAVRVLGLNLSSSFVSVNIVYDYSNEQGEMFNSIPFKRCTLEYLQNYSEAYSFWDLNQALCPDITSLQINGTVHNRYYTSLMIQVTNCVNDTNHPDIICMPKDQVTDYLENNMVVVGLFYSNTILTPTNYSEPITNYLDYTFWYSLPGTYTLENEIFINQQDIITDDNLLLEGWNVKNQTAHQIDRTEIRTQLNILETIDSLGNYTILNLRIEKSPKHYTTKRLYPKLQQGLANVGSIFSLCVGIFAIISALYIRRAFSVNIANSIFELDLQSPLDDRKNRFGQQSKKDTPITESKHIGGTILRTKKIKTQSQAPDKLDLSEDAEFRSYLHQFRPNKQTLTYNFADFLLECIPCIRRKKDVFIQNAIDAASKEIDLIAIVKKLQEFEQLKQILLDRDEQLMLSYLQPKVISLKSPSKQREVQESGWSSDKNKEKDSLDTAQKQREPKSAPRKGDPKRKESDTVIQSSKKVSESCETKDSRKTFTESYESYNRLLKKMKYSPISRKILKMMDPKISDAFFDFGMKGKARNGVKILKTKTKVNVVEQIKYDRAKKMSKLEAGLVICRNLESYYHLRKPRPKPRDPTNVVLAIHKKEPSNLEISLIQTKNAEKQPAKHETEQPEVLKRTEEKTYNATKINELKEMRPLKAKRIKCSKTPHQSKRVNSEISTSQSKQGLRKEILLPPDSKPNKQPSKITEPSKMPNKDDLSSRKISPVWDMFEDTNKDDSELYVFL